MKSALIGVTFLFMGLLHADVDPAKVSVHVVVVDQDDKPVSGADCKLGFNAPPENPQTEGVLTIRRITDSSGTVDVTAKTKLNVYCTVTKTGYYQTYEQYGFDQNKILNAFGEGKPLQEWQTEPLVMNVVLRKIINPIPMYARRINSGIPEFGKPLGFDFSVGDWVAPHGGGKTTDVIFTANLDKRTEQDFDYTLTVTFPNKGDGIQSFDAPYNQGSELKSLHQAPAEGYQPQWVQGRSEAPGQPAKSNYDVKHNYFFRVRTVLDEKGNVRSANYGKIYGDFMNFTFYLNPTPNDRNMEFDLDRNLITGLTGMNVVKHP